MPSKIGPDQLIPNNAVTSNIGCTSKILHAWIWDCDTIDARANGCRKSRLKVSAKVPRMEQELHKLFLQKRQLDTKLELAGLTEMLA